MTFFRGSNSSTGIVFDLISEGPISLVDGLNSIYLDRTPIGNKSAETLVTKKASRITVPAGGASFTIREGASTSSSALQNSTSNGNKVLVFRGGGQATITGITQVTGENKSTVTTSSSFFSSAMLTPDGTSIYKEKIRIPGKGPEGTQYVGDVVEYTSATEAVVSPSITNTTASGTIYYDHYAEATSIVPVYTFNKIFSYTVTLPSAIPNSALHGSTAFATVEGLDETTELNFNKTKVAFRSGTLNQTPQESVSAPSAATNITSINTEIKQHTDYFGANTKLRNFWGKYTLEYPDGATGGGEVNIAAATVSQGSVSEIDELILTISFPSGLYTAGGDGFYKEMNGALFQIFFEYKIGAGNYISEQIFGPTDAEISAADILVAVNTGTFRKNGGRHRYELRSNSEKAIDFDIRWSIEQYKPFTDFRIKVKKVTPDRLSYRDGINTFIADSSIKTVTTVINDKLSYPFAGYAALSFDSNELNGEFPERSYHCRGVEVLVPSNYVTREDSEDGVASYNRNVTTEEIESSYQVWDGNLVRAYCNNPVWNLREILVNKRWGLGHWLDDDSINDYSLYSLARYCDELVPDGQGGLEPRFTCGVYLRTPTEAYKVIKDFCSMMFALPYWVDGEFIVEGDRRGEPVYTFTKGNIIDGVFSYEGTGNKTRPNQIVVQFNDKDNFYDQDIELIDDVEDMIQKNRIFSEEVVAFGATTRSQAVRYGKWKLLTSRLQKEMVSFKTGINAGFLKPGSIIAIQDADKNTVRHSGRITASTVSSVTLDSSVSLPSGEDHTLYVQVSGSATYLAQESATISGITYSQGDIIAGVTTEEAAEVLVDDSGDAVVVQFVPDTHIVQKAITNTLPYSGNTIAVASPFASAPETEFIWAIVSRKDGVVVEGSAKIYRLLNISEEDDGTFTLSAIEHYNSKFDVIDEEYLADPPRTVSRYDDVPPITDFTASLIKEGSQTSVSPNIVRIALDWTRPQNTDLTDYLDIASYRITHINPNNETRVYDVPFSNTNYTVQDNTIGTHLFRISAVTGFGPVSTPVSTSVLVTKDSSNIDRLNLPVGGMFNKPLQLVGSDIVVPTEYNFTANSGKEVIVSASAPTSPIGGDIWYDTVNDELKTWSSITETWET